jgi:mRNA interferase MazF
MARGDVIMVDLPSATTQGREQAGRRPAIAVQTDEEGQVLPTIMVVPLTSQLASLRFPFTLRIEPTATNGLSQPSVLLAFQLRAIDRVRVSRTIGRLESHDLDSLDDMLRHLLHL